VGAAAWTRTLLARLLPPRCPRCWTVLERSQETLCPGEERETIVLPPIVLKRQTCPSCGYERQTVEADAGLTPFETGKRSRWAEASGSSPEEMKANVAAVMEWDRTLERLRNEYETDGENEMD